MSNNNLTEFVNNYPNNLPETESKISNIQYLNDLEFRFNNGYIKYIKLPRNFKIEKQSNHHVYPINIYSKQSFLENNSLNKKELVKILFEKSGINLKKVFNNKINFFRDNFSPKKIASLYKKHNKGIAKKELLDILEKKENYDLIIDSIINRVIKEEDIHEQVSEIIFNENGIEFDNLSEIFFISIEKILGSKGIQINERIFRHLFKSILRHHDAEMFGCVYKTIDFLNSEIYKSKDNKKAVAQTLRKLEMIGILDGVIRNKEAGDEDLKKYINNILNYNSEEKYNNNRISMHRKISKKNERTLIFPVVNMMNVVNIIDYDLTKKEFDYLLNSILNKIFVGHHLSEIFYRLETSDDLIAIIDEIKDIKLGKEFFTEDNKFIYFNEMMDRTKEYIDNIDEFNENEELGKPTKIIFNEDKADNLFNPNKLLMDKSSLYDNYFITNYIIGGYKSKCKYNNLDMSSIKNFTEYYNEIREEIKLNNTRLRIEIAKYTITKEIKGITSSHDWFKKNKEGENKDRNFINNLFFDIKNRMAKTLPSGIDMKESNIKLLDLIMNSDNICKDKNFMNTILETFSDTNVSPKYVLKTIDQLLLELIK